MARKNLVQAFEIDTVSTPTLDIRTHPGKEQIRGALRYNPKRLIAEEHLALPFAHDGPIVVYGDDDEITSTVVEHLRRSGYVNASVLDGGFEAYRDAGLPVENVTQEQPIPGQDGAGITLT